MELHKFMLESNQEEKDTREKDELVRYLEAKANQPKKKEAHELSLDEAAKLVENKNIVVGKTVLLNLFDPKSNRRGPTDVKITKVDKSAGTARMKVFFKQKGRKEQHLAVNIFKSKMVK